MEKNDKATGGIQFNLKKYLLLCLRSWKIFLLCIIVCGGLASTYALIKTEAYDVEAQLMLKDDAGGGSMMMLGELARSFSLGDMFGGASTTDNEASVMRSHSVMLRTAKDMDLNITYLKRRYGFKWVHTPLKNTIKLEVPEGISDTLSRSIVFSLDKTDNGKWNIKAKIKRTVIGEATDVSLPATLKTAWGSFTFVKTPYYASAEGKGVDNVKILLTSYAGAAESYAKLVKVYVPDRKTDFIGLSIRATEPEFGIELLNDIIRNYTDVGNAYKIDRSQQSLNLVNDRLQSLQGELLTSEHDLEKFKKEHNLTDVEVDASYLLNKTGEIESALLRAQTNFELAKMTRDFISNPKNNYSLMPDLLVTSGSALDGAPTQINQYNQMILERMQLLATAKSNNMAVKQLDEQIEAMRKNIITAVGRVYENAQVQLNDLKKENDKTQSRIGELPTLERQYITLKRDNLLQEQLYLFLLQQREELNMSLASRALPAQIIDAPHALVEPSGLTRKMIVLLGFMLGFVFAAAYVFIKKMNKAAVNDYSEFIGYMKAPVIGTLKPVKRDDSFVALGADSINAEPFRQLRADVQNVLKNCDGNTVVVSSLHSDEGKTYVAVNLAAALAKLGKKVLLIDAALRNPSVASAFGITNAKCALADYVNSRGGNDLSVCQVDVDANNMLSVATAAISENNASDVIGSDLTLKLIERLKSEYDYVVIDASPIIGYSEMGYLTDISDITIIVMRAGCDSVVDIDTVNDYFEEGRYKRIAVVANAFKS